MCSYEPKGAQISKQRQEAPKGIPGLVFADDAKTKTKSKESKQAAASSGMNDLGKKMSEIKISSKITAAQIEEDLRVKQIRKLKKVLREIQQIEEKMNGPDNTQPDKAQTEKLKKKEATIQELEDLGESVDDL